jgi:sialic acid synthase SpsE
MNLSVLEHYHGISDHTVGTHIPIAAVAMGASVIEKHIRPWSENFARANVKVDMNHPDHGDFALYPQAFAYMVRCIRDVEKALGDGIKRPMPGEAYEARGRRLESV